MKKASSAALLFALVAPTVLIAGPTGNADAGKTVYMKHCVACHGVDGNSKEAIAKMLNATIPPMSSKEVQALTDDAIKKGITEGQGKMKPVKDLSNDDVANVTAFIRTFAKK